MEEYMKRLLCIFVNLTLSEPRVFIQVCVRVRALAVVFTFKPTGLIPRFSQRGLAISAIVGEGMRERELHANKSSACPVCDAIAVPKIAAR